MNAQLTLDEIKSARELLKEYQPANEAIDAVERHNGNLETSFEELWIEYRQFILTLPRIHLSMQPGLLTV